MNSIPNKFNSQTYTITYNVQGINIEVDTEEIEFALYLSVEKKQVFNSDVICIRELVQLYISTAHELYLKK